MPRRGIPFREAEIDLAQLESNARALSGTASAHLLVDIGAEAWGHGIDVIVPALLDWGGGDGFILARRDEAERVRALAPDSTIVVTQHSATDDFAWMRRLRVAPALSSREEFDRAVDADLTTVMLREDDGSGVPGFDAGTFAACAVEARDRGITVIGSDVTVLGADLFGLHDDAAAEGSTGQTHPVLRLWAPVAATKRVGADEGVSYGYTYRTRSATTLALVTLGYSDGISRSGGSLVPVTVGDQATVIAGRVAMDAFMVDLGDVSPPALGTEATVLGDSRRGEPTASALGALLGMSGAEITTRLTARPHRYARWADTARADGGEAS